MMDIERLRRETKEELSRMPDPPADATFDEIDEALHELSESHLPSEEVVEFLLADVESVELHEDEQRVAGRVRRAAQALRAQVEPVGDLLARERRKASLTVEQVGRETGIDANLLRQVEEGRAVARLLNLAPDVIAAVTRRLAITPQLFAASLASSIPQPSSFVYGYRPRQPREEPATYHGYEDGAQLTSWLREYLSA